MLGRARLRHLEEMAARTVPGRDPQPSEPMALPPPIDEAGVLAELRDLAARNVRARSR